MTCATPFADWERAFGAVCFDGVAGASTCVRRGPQPLMVAAT